jgi:hypothetical protein
MGYTMSACWSTSGERYRDPHRARQAWGVMLVQQCRGVSHLDDDAALAERAGCVDTGQPHWKPCREGIADAGEGYGAQPEHGHGSTTLGAVKLDESPAREKDQGRVASVAYQGSVLCRELRPIGQEESWPAGRRIGADK